MVYYRTYRPQKITDLDNKQLRELLISLLSSKNIPHAFLFTGPKGLGKTSTARIIAKVINCEHVKNDEPDNSCEQCISINHSRNIDVLEIDGASNRGIDEIRELRDRILLAPSRARMKIYIIDEVHMLTNEAFNALLKTIEEPPLHVMFIFCTTEPHKIPPTIISRCFHLTFHLATTDEIVHSLHRIVIGEKLDIKEDALVSIAKMAEGGFRDAAKILEEVVALAKGEMITKQLIENKFHIVNLSQYATKLVNLMSKKALKESLEVITLAVSEGVNMQYLVQMILDNVHTILLNNIATGKDKNEIQFTVDDISSLVPLLSNAYVQIKGSPIPQLPLELVVISWCSNKLCDENTTRIIPGTSINNHTTIQSLLKIQQQNKLRNMLEINKSTDMYIKTKSTDALQSDLSSYSNNLSTLFDNIIYKVKPLNQSVAGVLRGSKIKEVTENSIIFETSYKFHKERLEETKACEIIEKAIREVTGKPLKVSVIIKNKGGE